MRLFNFPMTSGFATGMLKTESSDCKIALCLETVQLFCFVIRIATDKHWFHVFLVSFLFGYLLGQMDDLGSTLFQSVIIKVATTRCVGKGRII